MPLFVRLLLTGGIITLIGASVGAFAPRKLAPLAIALALLGVALALGSVLWGIWS